jgi:hypothetical protein
MGPLEQLYVSAPLWVLGLLMFGGMMLARELGAWISRRGARMPGGEDEEPEPFLVGAALSVLALLIAFTFSLALSRYDSRRVLVVHEANALGTTWLRTDLLDAPARDDMRRALRAYIDARVAWGSSQNAAEAAAAIRKADALQARFWKSMVVAVEPIRTTALAGLVVSTSNESIDAAAERVAERQAHIPARIFRMLTIFALVAAAMVGYHRGAHRHATTVLFLLLTLAITLVIDLDRPTTGMITVPQQPMLDLQRSIAQ